jgi:two-component system phosphate regulon response regulator PhoB
MNESSKTNGQSLVAAPRVMVVEDETDVALLISYNLEAEGYFVESVASGDEAELKLAESPPDLLILDWMLPGVSGIEVCRRLRSSEPTRSLPVIMVTAGTKNRTGCAASRSAPTTMWSNRFRWSN